MQSIAENKAMDFSHGKQEPTIQEQASFLTRDYRLLASNPIHSIRVPAANRAELNTQIKAAFKSAGNMPGCNPILVGAIPFDTQKPSSLFVYRDHEKHVHSTSADYQKGQKANRVDIEKIVRVVDEAAFQQTVNAALKSITCGELEKVVLSQSQSLQFKSELDTHLLLQHLRRYNPNAYVFSVPVGLDSVFLGASPELLLSKRDRKVVSNPLAGSIPRSQDNSVDQVKSNALRKSVKDNYEHRIVVDSIAQKIAHHCVELAISEYPHVLATNTMLHLSSTVRGYLRSEAPDALNIALDLHPTPAICGTPTAAAKDFILQNEGYDRGFYAGLVGWMDAHGNGDWAVSIRCGQLTNRQLNVFAGAGVVVGSDPQAEWIETESKLKTLMNIFSLQ